MAVVAAVAASVAALMASLVTEAGVSAAPGAFWEADLRVTVAASSSLRTTELGLFIWRMCAATRFRC